MQNLWYPARLSPEADGAFTVTFPDFPEAITSGRGVPDALAQASDCLGCALSGRIVDKREIPAPSRPKKGHCLVSVPLYIAPKVALYAAMRERRINNCEMARRLKVSETVVRRLLNPRHDTKPQRIQAALEALGKRILVAVGDAA